MSKRYWLIIFLFLIILLVVFIFNHIVGIECLYVKIFRRTGVIEPHNNKGKVDGTVIVFQDGVITGKASFINGLKNGWAIEYYPNGNVKRQQYFKTLGKFQE
jgi:hypothetical protein